MASYSDAQSQTPRRFMDNSDTHGDSYTRLQSKENVSSRRIQQTQRPRQSIKNSSAPVPADVQRRSQNIKSKILYRDQKAQTPRRFSNDSDTLADIQNRLQSIEDTLAILLSRLPTPSDEANPPTPSKSHSSNSQTYQNTSCSYSNHPISTPQQASLERDFQAQNIAPKNSTRTIPISESTSFEIAQPLLTLGEREQLQLGNKRLEELLHTSG